MLLKFLHVIGLTNLTDDQVLSFYKLKKNHFITEGRVSSGKSSFSIGRVYHVCGTSLSSLRYSRMGTFKKIIISVLCAVLAMLIAWICLQTKNIEVIAIILTGVVVFGVCLFFFFVNRYRRLAKIALGALVLGGWSLEGLVFGAKAFDIDISLWIETLSASVEPVILTICFVTACFMDWLKNKPSKQEVNRREHLEETARLNKEYRDYLEFLYDIYDDPTMNEAKTMRVAGLLARFPKVKDAILNADIILQKSGASAKTGYEFIKEPLVTRQADQEQRVLLSAHRNNVPDKGDNRRRSHSPIRWKQLHEYFMKQGYVVYKAGSKSIITRKKILGRPRDAIVLPPDVCETEDSIIPIPIIIRIEKVFDIRLEDLTEEIDSQDET